MSERSQYTWWLKKKKKLQLVAGKLRIFSDSAWQFYDGALKGHFSLKSEIHIFLPVVLFIPLGCFGVSGLDISAVEMSAFYPKNNTRDVRYESTAACIAGRFA